MIALQSLLCYLTLAMGRRDKFLPSPRAFVRNLTQQTNPEFEHIIEEHKTLDPCAALFPFIFHTLEYIHYFGLRFHFADAFHFFYLIKCPGEEST